MSKNFAIDLLKGYGVAFNEDETRSEQFDIVDSRTGNPARQCVSFNMGRIRRSDNVMLEEWILNGLVYGEMFSIKMLPFKPVMGGLYWTCNGKREVLSVLWENSEIDNFRLLNGLVWRSEEQVDSCAFLKAMEHAGFAYEPTPEPEPLPKEYTVTGKVTDSRGTPLISIPVAMVSGNDLRSVITDEIGCFCFEYVYSGEYTITAACDDRPYKPASKTIVVNGDLYTEIVMEQEHFVIAGTVTDADGQPIVGATVMIDDESRELTAESGFMFFGVMPGVHEVDVTCEGYFAVGQVVEVDDSTGDIRDLDFTLMPKYTINATVENEDGQPLEGVWVDIVGNEDTDVFRDYIDHQTDAGGEIWFGDLEKGSYTITADLDGYFETEKVVEAAGDSIKPIEVEIIMKRSYIVTISVKDAQDKPLENVAVTLTKEGAAEAVLSGTTDAQGVFVADDVYSGSYGLTASLAGYVEVTQDVEIAGESEEVEVAIVMEQEQGVKK